MEVSESFEINLQDPDSACLVFTKCRKRTESCGHSNSVGKKLMLLAAVPFLAAVPLGCADPAYGARQDHDFTGQVKTVGDPNHPDELPSALSEAYRSGVRRINIRPGTYNFSKTGHPLFNFTESNNKKVILKKNGAIQSITPINGGKIKNVS